MPTCIREVSLRNCWSRNSTSPPPSPSDSPPLAASPGEFPHYHSVCSVKLHKLILVFPLPLYFLRHPPYFASHFSSFFLQLSNWFIFPFYVYTSIQFYPRFILWLRPLGLFYFSFSFSFHLFLTWIDFLGFGHFHFNLLFLARFLCSIGITKWQLSELFLII